MFGNHHDDDNKPATEEDAIVSGAMDESTSAPATDASDDSQSFLPTVSANDAASADEPEAKPAEETPAADPEPAPAEDKHEEHKEEETPELPSRNDDAGASSDLLQLKRQALQQLSPLVGHLEQSPEDRFRTLMMMIQAADDKSLIGDAYETAQKIEDEKVRAEALLDVVNEINYFTQQDKEADA